jgi:UDP-GlcNAc:undecaprenyl-phosphate/decaprenyl-phosphate GlcNAc-1-phosphate transferase
MIVILLLLTALSMVLSLIFTPAVRSLAFRWNLVDLPDNKRKVHKKPIPRVGGIALAAAYFGSCFVVLGLLSLFHVGGPFGFAAIKSITPATLLIFGIGLLDDIFTLKAWQKFAVQIVAAMLVVSAGVHMGGLSIFTAHPLLGKVVTVLWLVGCTNAVNLIDGLDGLAAGIALLATTTTLVASLMSGHMELTVATVPLAGALIGFLVFNFNPASIFLGDSGSLVLGFLLGCYSILWSSKSATLLGMTAPVIALSVPLLDTTLAIIRRFLRAQPIFKPDRSHIHHRLLARGLTHRRTVLLLYAASAVAGTFSLGLIWARDHWEAVILVAFACAAISGVRELSYAEFEAARRVLLRGGLRRGINAELAVQSFEADLEAAATPHACWLLIERVSHEFGFRATRMQFSGRMFGAQKRDDGTGSSAIVIAITKDDWVELSLGAHSVQHPNALVPFATTMRRVLADKGIDRAHTPAREAETARSTVRYETVPSLMH